MPSEDSEDEDYNPGANCYRDKGANLRLDGSGNESASDPSVEGEEDSDSNSDSYPKNRPILGPVSAFSKLLITSDSNF